MDAYEKIYKVRMEYDEDFEQCYDLEREDCQHLLNEIQHIKLPNMKSFTLNWHDQYLHSGVVRKFLSHSLPDKLEDFSFEMLGEHHREKSKQFLKALLKSDLHVTKRFHLKNHEICQEDLQTVLSRFKKCKEIELEYNHIRVEHGFMFKKACFKGWTCRSLNFNGTGSRHGARREDFENLVDALAGIPAIRRSVKTFFFHDCHLDEEFLHDYLHGAGFTDVKIEPCKDSHKGGKKSH
jgi:hypothetical protein